MTTPHYIRFATALLAIALAIGACSSSPSKPAAATPELADADQLLVLALRTWAVDENAQQALQLAERAAAAAPGRADVAWLHLRLCTQVQGCEPQAFEARFKKLAPDNGVVWLSVLSRVQKDGDAQTEEQILAAMSRADHFNVYWTSLLWRITAALHASAPPRNGKEAAAPLTAALNDSTGWLSALLLPAFKPLNSACAAERIRDAQRRARCESISQALQRGDAYVVEGLGLGIAQRLAAPGTTAAAQIEQRIETLGYQNRNAGAVMSSQLERDKFSAEVLELMKKLAREQDVSLAILRWAGQPLTP
ncbi:MAG: hypothetical protein ACREV5_09055 [Steroidobacter sp.]